MGRTGRRPYENPDEDTHHVSALGRRAHATFGSNPVGFVDAGRRTGTTLDFGTTSRAAATDFSHASRNHFAIAGSH